MQAMLQSLNYAPSADLAPYVKQHFVFRAPLPEDFTLIDQLCSETAVIRVLLGGDWAAEFPPADWRYEGPGILFGANSKCFRVRVRGPFTVVGVALRPSGWHGLFDWKAQQFTDNMWSLRDLWGELSDRLYNDLCDAGDCNETMVAAIEAVVRDRLKAVNSYAFDPQMAAFENIAREDSTIRVADAAEQIGLSDRAMERRCCATFGLTPKAILRRSRFLDMAAVFRGISNPDAEERAALRFSDQSHLNREFRHFVNMTPGAFEKASTPLLNAVLKLREDGIA
jgi:AraC-like DNA-binding protein